MQLRHQHGREIPAPQKRFDRDVVDEIRVAGRPAAPEAACPARAARRTSRDARSNSRTSAPRRRQARNSRAGTAGTSRPAPPAARENPDECGDRSSRGRSAAHRRHCRRGAAIAHRMHQSLDAGACPTSGPVLTFASRPPLLRTISTRSILELWIGMLGASAGWVANVNAVRAAARPPGCFHRSTTTTGSIANFAGRFLIVTISASTSAIAGRCASPIARRSSMCTATAESRPSRFGALMQMSNRLANALRAHGIGRGDRVAILLPQIAGSGGRACRDLQAWPRLRCRSRFCSAPRRWPTGCRIPARRR